MFPCSYDDEADKVNQYQRLNLDGLEKIEIGKTFASTRAEVRISALTESPDTSRKCARQFLCNRLAVSPQKNDSHAADAAERRPSQVVFPSPGPEPTLFGKPKFCCMRLHYKNEETSGYFHTLRAATRNPEDDGKGGNLSHGKTSLLRSSHIFVWTYSVMLCRRHVTVHS